LDKPLLPQDIEAVDHEDVIESSPFHDDTYVQETEEDNGEKISAVVSLAQRPCKFKFIVNNVMGQYYLLLTIFFNSTQETQNIV